MSENTAAPEQLYERIRRRNAQKWGTERLDVARKLGAQLHPDSTDLLAELVQNAEDAGARTVSLTLTDDVLIVTNDGRAFSDRDVRGISALLASEKEEQAIGYFGIGFKSVLALTQEPTVVSGPYTFRLVGCLDPYPADLRSLPARPRRSSNSSGATFYLPLRDPTQANISRMRDRLLSDGAHLLRFLRYVEELQWRTDTERIEVKIHRESDGTIVRCSDVASGARTVRVDGWGVLPAEVADRIAAKEAALGSELADRVRQRMGSKIPVSVSFDLDPVGVPKAANGEVSSRLPTRTKSGLKFHVDGWFPVSLDRSNVRWDDPLSGWMVEVLAEHAVASLRSLSSAGLMRGAGLAVLPRTGEVDEPLAPMATALVDELQSGAYFHSSDQDLSETPRPAKGLWLPDDAALLELLTRDDLRAITGDNDTAWAHAVFHSGRLGELALKAGARRLTSERVIDWLKSVASEPDFTSALAGRGRRWFGRLYLYLAKLTKENALLRYELQDLPLALTELGVVPLRQAVMAQDRVDDETRKLAEFCAFVIDPKVDGALEALNALGAHEFSVAAVERGFVDRYDTHEAWEADSASDHLRALAHLRLRDETPGWGSVLRFRPWVPCSDGTVRKPDECYLPRELGGDQVSLRVVRNAGFPSVDRRVIEGVTGDDRRIIAELLNDFGAARSPRVRAELVATSYANASTFATLVKERGISTGWSGSSREAYLYDSALEGLGETIRSLIGGAPNTALAAGVLAAIGSAAESETTVTYYPARTHWRLQFPQSICLWFWYQGYVDSGESAALTLLRGGAWLPDGSGDLARPVELFSPELRGLLGDDVRYVHPDAVKSLSRRTLDAAFDIVGVTHSVAPADVIAQLDRVAAELSDEALLARSRPIFSWLRKAASKNDIRSVLPDARVFAVPGRGRFTAREVCWHDPTGSVASLREHWEEDWGEWFTDVLGIRRSGDLSSLIGYIESSIGVADGASIVGALREITAAIDELSDQERKRLVAANCWPAQQDNQLYSLSALLVADDPALGRRLRPTPPTVDPDFNDVAVRLGASRLSRATTTWSPLGDRTLDDAASRRLAWLWPAIHWLGSDALPPDAPSVERVEEISASYEIGAYKGTLQKPPAGWYERAAGIVFVGSTSKRIEAAIGDAIEQATRASHMREFVKDLWLVRGDELGELLAEWADREGRPIPKLDLEASPDDMRSRASPSASGNVSNGPERRGAGPTSNEGRTTAQLGPRGEFGQPRPHAVRRREPKDQRFSVPRGIDGEGALEVDRETEARAVIEATAWLEGRDADVTDVSDEKLGYDLNVVLHQTGEIWHVEVKGLGRTSGSVIITRRERESAAQPGWKLCVVAGLKQRTGELHWIDGAAVSSWPDEAFEPMTFRVRDWARDGEVVPIEWTTYE